MFTPSEIQAGSNCQEKQKHESQESIPIEVYQPMGSICFEAFACTNHLYSCIDHVAKRKGSTNTADEYAAEYKSAAIEFLLGGTRGFH